MRAPPAEALQDRRRIVLAASAAVAAALFAAVFVAASAMPRRTVRARVAPVRLRFVEAVPRQRQLGPPPAQRPERTRPRTVRRPPSLGEPAPVLPAPPGEAPAAAGRPEPAPLIAGLTLSSTTAAGQGPRFGVGNTLLGTPAVRAADPEAVPPPPGAVSVARSEARLLEGAAPGYSAEARRAGIEGVVVLALWIDASGHVEEARLVRGLGYGLDEAALRAARETRWAPATLAGAAVRSTRRFTVRFALRS